MEAGNEYRVTSGSIVYNSIMYVIGAYFITIDGVTRFTSSDEGKVTLVATDLVIKTSYSDFLKSMIAVLNVGFGVERGKVVLEDKAYFFKDILQITDLGEVKEFSLKVYTDYLVSSLKIGYPDQTYDITNGVDKYNSEQNDALPIVRYKRSLT